MFVSMGPFVPICPSGRPSCGRILVPAPPFCFQCLAALVGLLLAIFPFLCRSALLVFFFTSLNSCLSETWSLGPRSTVVAMATEAFILPATSRLEPSVWNPQSDRWEGSHPGIISTLDGNLEGPSTSWAEACLKHSVLSLFLNKHPHSAVTAH